MCGLTQASLYTGEHFQDKQPTFGEEKSNSWTVTGYEDERSCTHAQKKYANGRDFSKGRRGWGWGALYTNRITDAHKHHESRSWKLRRLTNGLQAFDPQRKRRQKSSSVIKVFGHFKALSPKRMTRFFQNIHQHFPHEADQMFLTFEQKKRSHLQLTFCWPTTWQHNDPLTIKQGHIWSTACVASFSHYYLKKNKKKTKTLSSCNKELPYRYESGAQMHYCLVLNYAQCKQWHALYRFSFFASSVNMTSCCTSSLGDH